MRRLLGLLSILLATATLGGGAGCGRQEEPANPHLKTPEVAPAGHGSRPVPASPGKKK
jgi:hypothetical protein